MFLYKAVHIGENNGSFESGESENNEGSHIQENNNPDVQVGGGNDTIKEWNVYNSLQKLKVRGLGNCLRMMIRARNFLQGKTIMTPTIFERIPKLVCKYFKIKFYKDTSDLLNLSKLKEGYCVMVDSYIKGRSWPGHGFLLMRLENKIRAVELYSGVFGKSKFNEAWVNSHEFLDQYYDFRISDQYKINITGNQQ